MAAGQNHLRFNGWASLNDKVPMTSPMISEDNQQTCFVNLEGIVW